MNSEKVNIRKDAKIYRIRSKISAANRAGFLSMAPSLLVGVLDAVSVFFSDQVNHGHILLGLASLLLMLLVIPFVIKIDDLNRKLDRIQRLD